ncbi:hypothetical protein X801_06251 [Opisthorchis viverrini]|uniref:Reverse transcriptase domain-containing protein n=1 Tax=Opisthorchis viverrini TaxID=6198 RepID=A0A1S8WTU6_OPIVI|nr:hypothetical protein X801_06251 [Opisthorchis viverrini]
MEEHLRSFKLVLDRLKERRLRIKKEKCDFPVNHVDYLSFRISANDSAPLAEKIRLILKASQLRNKREIRSFLGMVDHYARFISQSATLFHPLNYLLCQGHYLFGPQTSTWNSRREYTNTLSEVTWSATSGLRTCMQSLSFAVRSWTSESHGRCPTIKRCTITCAKTNRAETRKDPELSQVLCFTSQGWPENVQSALNGFYERSSELCVEDGCLLGDQE